MKLPTFIKSLFWYSLTAALIPLFIWLGTASLDPHLPQPDDPPRLYSNQARADFTLTLSKAIERAGESVHLAIYTLSDPKIIAALKAKAEEGKQVYVLHDKSSRGLKKRLGPKIVQVKREISGLMHQKILVIDTQEVWIGSANMTRDSLKSQANFLIALNSSDLAKSILATLKSRLPHAPPFPLARHSFETTGQQFEFWQQPSEKGGLERIIELIGGAKKTLRIAMFTWTHPLLTQAVIEAYKRGVKVEAVIDRGSGEGVSHKTVVELAKAHIPVGLSIGPALFHHKLAWIDGTTLICGSTNWTRAAFTRNEDAFLVLHDLSPEQQQVVEKMWQISQKGASNLSVHVHVYPLVRLPPPSL